MRILIVTQYYKPDIAPASFRMAALVEELCTRGHEVTVLTATPNSAGVDREFVKDYCVKDVKGIGCEKVIRLPLFPQNSRSVYRLLNYAVFSIELLARAMFLGEGVDVVLATTPPLPVAFIGSIIARILGAKIVVDVRDIWPDIMLDMGVISTHSPVYRVLKLIEVTTMKRADMIFVASPGYVRHYKYMVGYTPVVLMNGIDEEFWQAIQKKVLHGVPPMRPPYVITYAGNVGLSQRLSEIVDVFKEFEGKFIFRIIGNGADLPRVREVIEREEMQNVEILKSVLRERLLEYYGDTNAFIVHLRDIPMFEKTIPSKIFEYAATGRPILFGLKGVGKSILVDILGLEWTDLLYFRPGNKTELRRALNNLYNVLESGYVLNKDAIFRVKEKYLRKTLMKEALNQLDSLLVKSNEDINDCSDC